VPQIRRLRLSVETPQLSCKRADLIGFAGQWLRAGLQTAEAWPVGPQSARPVLLSYNNPHGPAGAPQPWNRNSVAGERVLSRSLTLRRFR
jgi:hypothetical protein